MGLGDQEWHATCLWSSDLSWDKEGEAGKTIVPGSASRG